MGRSDFHVEVPAIKYEDLEEASDGETSADIRKRVEVAREIQLEKFRRSRSSSISRCQQG